MIENSKKPIPVLVSGALGRMGSEVVKTVLNSTDCELVAAIDINKKNNGSNISELLNVENCDVLVSNDFEGTLCSVSQNYRNEKIKPVLVDFTHPDSVYENTRSAIAYGVSPRRNYRSKPFANTRFVCFCSESIRWLCNNS